MEKKSESSDQWKTWKPLFLNLDSSERMTWSYGKFLYVKWQKV